MRTILSNTFICSRCELQNTAGATHCVACGFDLSSSSSSAQSNPPAQNLSSKQGAAATTPAVSAGARVAATPANAAASVGLFGNRTLEGTVIHVGPSHLTYPVFRWGKLLVRIVVLIGLVLVFGTIAIIIAMTVFLLSLLMSWILGPAHSRGAFFRSVTSQFVGFYMTSHLPCDKQPIPVTDYRLRDSSGLEHLVRVEGYVITGGMNVGDDVRVEGTDRGGTLVLKRGWNKRLRTVIKVKRL